MYFALDSHCTYAPLEPCTPIPPSLGCRLGGGVPATVKRTYLCASVYVRHLPLTMAQSIQGKMQHRECVNSKDNNGNDYNNHNHRLMTMTSSHGHGRKDDQKKTSTYDDDISSEEHPRTETYEGQ